jgi:hypothetical protein
MPNISPAHLARLNRPLLRLPYNSMNVPFIAIKNKTTLIETYLLFGF